MKSYSGDPYWTTAKFDSVTADGEQVRRGDRIFYYPRGRVVLIGAKAEAAAADFMACAQDEAFANGEGF